MEDIQINPGTIPSCPRCGETEWTVHQHIKRRSKLLKVDGLGDMQVELPDESLYEQSLVLVCVGCSAEYAPQSGVVAIAPQTPETVEAYSDTGLHNWPNAVSNEVGFDESA